MSSSTSIPATLPLQPLDRLTEVRIQLSETAGHCANRSTDSASRASSCVALAPSNTRLLVRCLCCPGEFFGYRRRVGPNIAIESLKEALRQRKAMPAKIGQYADQAGVWETVRLYLEALTVDG